MDKMEHISQEILNRYVSGKATLEEITKVSLAMKQDKQFKEMVTILEDLHRNGVLSEDGGDIPLASMAAMSEDNLCDVMCEHYILKDYFQDSGKGKLEGGQLDNRWMKESGTPLYDIGRILESNGMTVTRKFDCTPDELSEAFENRYRVIAIVDYGQLWNRLSDGIFHAVVCLNIVDGVIRIFDPAIDGCSNYTFEEFCKAWHYSRNYMVCASANGLKYHPHPINVSDIVLDDDLVELTEAIAENAHEVWAAKRQSEGWKYGPKRDDTLLEHPDMIPYCELTESEKYYDRDVAMNTIRLVKKLGFNISRRNTEYCRHCGEFVSDDMRFCPHCGEALQ